MAGDTLVGRKLVLGLMQDASWRCGRAQASLSNYEDFVRHRRKAPAVRLEHGGNRNTPRSCVGDASCWHV